jgi:hypothetical protein
MALLVAARGRAQLGSEQTGTRPIAKRGGLSTCNRSTKHNILAGASSETG